MNRTISCQPYLFDSLHHCDSFARPWWPKEKVRSRARRTRHYVLDSSQLFFVRLNIPIEQPGLESRKVEFQANGSNWVYLTHYSKRHTYPGINGAAGEKDCVLWESQESPNLSGNGKVNEPRWVSMRLTM